MDLLLEDVFEVTAVDSQGKKFDKVSRLDCRGTGFQMTLRLDVNTDLFEADVQDQFRLRICKAVDVNFDQMSTSEFAGFDYVMYGKIFKIDAASDNQFEVYVSFGGLLLLLKGEAQHVRKLPLDQRVFLCVKRS
ncbi:MAG: hypothetical protein MHM6MM_007586 [Cercozoa sp. M6MM]